MLYNFRGDDYVRFKLDFYDCFLERAASLQSEGKQIVCCGDVNTAHREIDLSNPKSNSKVSGFLPEERIYIDKFAEAGLIDTFRLLHPDREKAYTWWSYKTKARERNVGWRIDYFFINEPLKDSLKSAFIMKDVQGSDHCPIGIEL